MTALLTKLRTWPGGFSATLVNFQYWVSLVPMWPMPKTFSNQVGSGFTAADTSTALAGNDVRGTYAVQSAADSVKVLEMRIWMTDYETSDGAFGVDPYRS